jgi:hypothetical protein
MGEWRVLKSLRESVVIRRAIKFYSVGKLVIIWRKNYNGQSHITTNVVNISTHFDVALLRMSLLPRDSCGLWHNTDCY